MPYNYNQDPFMQNLAYDIMDWYDSRHINNVRDTPIGEFPRPEFLNEDYLQSLTPDQRAEVENIISNLRTNAHTIRQQPGGKRKKSKYTKSKRSKYTKSKRSK